MPIVPGARLGPYEITGAIGAGGMGEVFRAHDTKLNRDVAIKVLPAAFADDPERLARFTREAQTLAALNHPNIAAIYGIEDPSASSGTAAGSGSPGVLALVMELVEGEDLSTHIARGPIPFAEALPIARQIAEALEAAHEQGIVHRDLKPANIKVRTDGTVKVLDFGLAKAMDQGSGSASNPNVSHSPTLTHHGTSVGMIIGTAAYMSPEQAKGKTVDKRADIWAFGVVLYEMLSGKRAFKGDDVSETLASVLKDTLSMDALPADTPPRLKRLIERCLDRDLKTRLRDIGEARVKLARIEAGGPDSAASAPSTAGSANVHGWHRAAPWATLAGLLGVALAACLLMWSPWWPRGGSLLPQRVQFSVATQGGEGLGSRIDAPQISPDGSLLAFASPPPEGGRSLIWIRPIGEGEARPLAGTEGASGLFWSPDSRSIGYAFSGKIHRVSADGEAPRALCEVSGGFLGAAWMRSGSIVVATSSGGVSRLLRVPEQGGAPVDLKTPQGASISDPSPLPDGVHFLYLDRGSSNHTLYAGSLDGGAPVRLMETEFKAVYAGPGFLLFVRDGTLFAQPFQPTTLKPSGEPIRLANDVLVGGFSGQAAVSASDNGTLVYRTSSGGRLSDLVWLDRAGKPGASVGDAANYVLIRLSPDGKRAATSMGAGGGRFTTSVLDLGNGVPSAIAAGKNAIDVVWSPDGKTVAYGARPSKFFTELVGSQNEAPMFESKVGDALDDWSADGKFLLFHNAGRLFALEFKGPPEPRLLLDTRERIDEAHFSPDGKWVAYQVTESGTYQVWVASFPAFDQRRRVSVGGGGEAVWGRDGKELFYLTSSGSLMRAKVDRDPEGGLAFGTPTELFQSPLTAPALVVAEYSVSNDGQRFLFIRPRPSTGGKSITVVVNWAANLAGK